VDTWEETTHVALRVQEERVVIEGHLEGGDGVNLVLFEKIGESRHVLVAAYEGVRGEGEVFGLGVDLTAGLE
jgi:hypothetical protein